MKISPRKPFRFSQQRRPSSTPFSHRNKVRVHDKIIILWVAFFAFRAWKVGIGFSTIQPLFFRIQQPWNIFMWEIFLLRVMKKSSCPAKPYLQLTAHSNIFSQELSDVYIFFCGRKKAKIKFRSSWMSIGEVDCL